MDSPYIGMIQYFAFDWAPRTYALCNGAILPINTNQALFALLGTTYGGNGVSTFALPDLRGRAIMGQSNSQVLGEKLGSETATLLAANMPLHTHTAAPQISAYVDTRDGGQAHTPANTHPASPINGELQYTATAGANQYLAGVGAIVGNAGNGTPFSTLNPYLALSCSICTQGLFPPRS